MIRVIEHLLRRGHGGDALARVRQHGLRLRAAGFALCRPSSECSICMLFLTRWFSSSSNTLCAVSACLRSLTSTSTLTAPMSVPEASCSGVGYGMNGTRVPSGRSATASAPRTGRFSFSATAMGIDRTAAACRPAGTAARRRAIRRRRARADDPQLDHGVIVECDPAEGIGGIDGGGQPFEQLAKLALPFAQFSSAALRSVMSSKMRTP